MAEVTTIEVGGEHAYPVLVGWDVLDEVGPLLSGGVRQVAVIHAPTVRDRVRALCRSLETRDVSVLPLEVPDAEAAKTAEVAARCWAELGRRGFTRSDAVIGVGGGATTDLAGFVAATWLRGVPVLLVPTTMLGMVDAAVGGKTGINTGEGKNLVGAFHPPAGVVCDLRWLDTLPQRDFVAGLAEVVKCGFIADPEILALIESDLPSARAAGGPHTRELVERSVRVKAHVVSQDLRESGLREILNYGHTLGHAIEQVEGYRWRHGDAISVGMVFVAELAGIVRGLPAGLVERHRDVLGGLGLPLTYRAAAWPDLLSAMRVDKKARGAQLRFVVLEGLARPGVLADPDPRALRDAFGRVGPA